MMGVAEIATGVVALVAPYLPQLTSLVGDVAGKRAASVVEKTGDAAWEKAKAIWCKITARIGDDRRVSAASVMVAEEPDREDLHVLLAEKLAQRLGSDPVLLEELRQLMGGDRGVQEVVGGNRAVIEQVSQRMGGRGTQTVRGGNDARISGVVQDMGAGSEDNSD
jgi:hypothetical protein